MIVLVDNEHQSGYAQPWGEKIMAARVRIKYDLENMSGHECLIVRWGHVSIDLLDRIDAAAIFISGNSAQPDQYPAAETRGLHDALLTKRWPTFGFCGGHQVIGDAFGAPLEPIGELEEGAEAFGEAADFAPGLKSELGYFPVDVTRPHPILEGVGDAPVVRHAHSWELKALPDGFSNYAATDMTPIQLMIHDEAPLVGTQFHPEYATDEHPAGRTMIENFMNWAGITR
ncbi:MAG: gamma-glutamyl-gamma-aminobutyrate hydrolase family protein [Acidimicrobiia bacterium]|nr:gamma-glutamyl-gamma-aminobutyrate hydrolase family protein [Acidimicrobiia bacterium]